MSDAAPSQPGTENGRGPERLTTMLAVLNEIGQASSAGLSLDELFQVVYTQVGRVFDATNFYIATYQEGSDEWTSAFRVERGRPQPPDRYKLGAGLTSHILRTRRSILLNSAHDNRAFHTEHGVTHVGELARSWLGVPLIAADHVVGAMAIQSYDQENLYTDQDLALFSTIASQTAIAIQNARLLGERLRAEELLRRQNEYLEALHDTTLGLMGRLSLTELLETIITRAGALLGTTHGYIYLLEPGGAQMRARVGLGIFSHLVNSPLLPGQGLSGQVWQTGQPAVVSDYKAWMQNAPPGAYDRLRAVAAVPLRAAAEGASSRLAAPRARGRTRRQAPERAALGPRIIGVLGLAYLEEQRTFGQTEIQILGRFAELASVALDNAQLFDEIRKRTEQTQILMRVSETAASTLDSLQVMQYAAREAVRALGADMAGVYLLDVATKTMRPVAHYHVPPELLDGFLRYQPSLENRLVAEACQARQAILASDAANDPRVDQNLQRLLTAQTMLLCPMSVKETVVGAVWLVWWKKTRPLLQEELRLVEGIVRQAAVAVENARLFEQTRAALDELETVQRRYLQRAWSEYLQTAPATSYETSLPNAPPLGDAVLPEIQAALAGRGATVLAPEPDQPRSAVIAPVSLRGQVIGVLGVRDESGARQWTDEEITLVEAVAERMAQAAEGLRLVDEIQRRAARERMIGQITARVRSSATVDAILQRAAEELGRTFGAARTSIRLEMTHEGGNDDHPPGPAQANHGD